MLEDWWKLSKQELAQDEQAQAAKQVAYHSVLYGSTYGRQVMFDLTNLCYERMPASEATLARIDLLHQIKANCGVGPDEEMAAIEAESK